MAYLYGIKPEHMKNQIILVCCLVLSLLMAACKQNNDKPTPNDKPETKYSTRATGPEADKAWEQAKSLATATVKGDYAFVIDKTHPNVVAMAGGKEAMVEAVKMTMDNMLAEGVTIDSAIVFPPSALEKGDGEWHCLLKETLFMTFSGGQIVADSYLFGFSNDKGQNWLFVEADQMEKMRGALFPDLQTKIEIPAKTQPKVISTPSEK